MSRQSIIDEALVDVKGREWLRRWMEAESKAIIHSVGILDGPREQFIVAAAFTRYIKCCTRAQTPNLYSQWKAAVTEHVLISDATDALLGESRR